MVVPLIRRENGAYSAHVFGEQRRFTEADLASVEKEVRNAGFYPYRTDPDEMAVLEADDTCVDRLFLRLMRESVSHWIELATERLKPQGIRCYVSPGNDDHLSIDDLLKSADYLVPCEEEVVPLTDQHEMLTFGWSTPTPWKSPRECSEAELGQRIESLAGRVSNMERCVFNLHSPPFNTAIDLAPQLDETLRPLMRGGQIMMAPVGSQAVRASIEHHQPLLALHGHIHESRGFTYLGRTPCINPGSEYGDGILRGCLIDLNGNRAPFTLVSG